jgi:outer membrane protein, multidrug efflux system
VRGRARLKRVFTWVAKVLCLSDCLLAVATALLAAGCTVGPDYHRPEVPTPAAYRGADTAALAPGAKTLGDVEWWTIFQDPVLVELVRTALAANYDLRIAVERILQAQAQVTIARSQLFPTLNAQIDGSYTRYTGGKKPPPSVPRETFLPEGGASVAWELDLWGRIRRATESARAQLLATEEFRNGVVTTLVAAVATAYFDLRALDLELEISKHTVDVRLKSRDLVQARLQGGVAHIIDLYQAEELLYTATENIPDVERRIQETENFIATLLGRAQGPIPRGRPLLQQLAVPTVPVGLPSELLARRPDVRQVEQQLVAANAQIGAAKALFFPQVTITGFAGGGGVIINGQTSGPFGIFSALPTITLPMFNAGRVKAGVSVAESQTREAVLRYQQTIQEAIREVADGLVDLQKRREFREQQTLLTQTLDKASQVAEMRYQGGVASYLEVLDTERQLFGAQLSLVQAQLDEQAAVIQLYKALGGGWQTEQTAPSWKGQRLIGVAAAAASEAAPGTLSREK